MARTIEEIKKSMLDSYKESKIVQKKYGVTKVEELEFSKASLENTLFYVIAVMIWTIEVLFDRHKEEVKEHIRQMKPHGLLWYANKAKAFRYGKSLEKNTIKHYGLYPDTDIYPDTYTDDEGNIITLSEKDIEALQIVKFAAAGELRGGVCLKIAKEGKKEDRRLEEKNELPAFIEYMQEVKDAGVRVEIINEKADKLRLELDVYVNPMLINKDGEPLDPSGKSVKSAIEDYITNLPFDGEYRNADLVDALQALDGVVIPELKNAWTKHGDVEEPINAKAVPYSGYYILDADNSDIEYIHYKSK